MQQMARKKWVSAVTTSGANDSPAQTDPSAVAGPDDEMVVLVKGFNSFGDPIFNYLKVKFGNVDNFMSAINSGSVINVRDYGEVLAAGTGEPSFELSKEMEKTYHMVKVRKKPQESQE